MPFNSVILCCFLCPLIWSHLTFHLVLCLLPPSFQDFLHLKYFFQCFEFEEFKKRRFFQMLLRHFFFLCLLMKKFIKWSRFCGCHLGIAELFSGRTCRKLNSAYEFKTMINLKSKVLTCWIWWKDIKGWNRWNIELQIYSLRENWFQKFNIIFIIC